MYWLVDGNNVFGSRPDGWWNDRPKAMARLTQRVAEWSRTHTDSVTLVFDQPVPATVTELAGGNLRVRPASRRGRNAGDDELAEIAATLVDDGVVTSDISVVTSDRGLRERLPHGVRLLGAGAFRELIDY